VGWQGWHLYASHFCPVPSALAAPDAFDSRENMPDTLDFIDQVISSLD
jgi:hypothetical protein